MSTSVSTGKQEALITECLPKHCTSYNTPQLNIQSLKPGLEWNIATQIRGPKKFGSKWAEVCPNVFLHRILDAVVYPISIFHLQDCCRGFHGLSACARHIYSDPFFFYLFQMLTFILSMVSGQEEEETEIRQQADHVISYSQLPIPCT